MIDTTLASYATVRQLEYLEAVEVYGSNAKAAAALGVNRRGLDQSLTRLRALAASRGHSPAHCISEAGRDEIRRTLSYIEAPAGPAVLVLAEADE